MSYSVLITCSYIKSHPSIKIIKQVIESLDKTNIKPDTPIILAHDSLKRNGDNNLIYEQYLENLRQFIKNKPNIQIVRRETHGHLVGNVRNAFQYINTDYVLLIQHDFEFIREFDIEKIIDDMQNNSNLKHIRFNKRTTQKKPMNMDLKPGKDYVPYGVQYKCKNYTYTQTPGWSDNNHLVSSAYYRNIILPECQDGRAMERHFKLANDHNKYGTFIFDKLNEKPYILHLDGRKSN